MSKLVNALKIFVLFFLFSVLIFILVTTNTQASSTSNWQIYAGSSTSNGLVTVAKYYPQTITVDEGDSITWKVVGDAHTISFLSGAPAPNPLSIQAQQPSGGNTYNGSGFVSSGIVAPGGTYTITFTKSGTYTYNCLIHPGMSATVVVQPAGTAYPKHQNYYTKTYQNQKSTDISAGLRLLHQISIPQAKVNTDGTKTYFNTAGIGNGTESVMRFFNKTRVIKVGDSITWTNKDLMMPHTVTFAGNDGKYNDIFTPVGSLTYDGSTFTSSGILMANQSYTLKFTKPGKYKYVCLLHDDIGMTGTVTVLPK